MSNHQTLCEACLENSSTAPVKSGADHFSLCLSCTKHLKARSLLPIEWYRLIVHHSENADYINHRYYYHNGISILPEIKRELTSESDLPKFDDIKNDMNALIDSILFPFSPVDTQTKMLALSSFPPLEILKRLEFLMKTYPAPRVARCCYQICLTLLENCKEGVASFVKNCWESGQLNALDELVSLSIRCFSVDEVFNWTTDLIKKNAYYGHALACFPKDKAIPWLVENITSPAFSWGPVAARLQITWDTIEKWLAQGRPLSLLALGTLKTMCTAHEPEVKLYEPASIEKMTAVLNNYYAIDQATTVCDAIQLIFSNWNLCLKEGYIPLQKPMIHADPFMGKIDKIHHIDSYHIKKFSKIKKPTTELITHFGGQPDWLLQPEWPTSKSTGKPMQFIGQIILDKQLFPETEAQIAYLFMTDEINGETWDPNSGENAVILQPGNNGSALTSIQQTGPTVSEFSYAVEMHYVREPDYIPLDALSTLLSSKKKEKDYYRSIEGNKVGGLPLFIQSEEYPDPDKKWNLLLQLNMNSVPFPLNIGDDSVVYAFISADGTCAKLLWQS